MDDAAEKLTNVKISPAAFALLKGLATKTGMKQWVVVERVLTWLSTQPEAIQYEFVIPGGKPAEKMIELRDAERAASGEVPPVTLEQAVKQMRSLVEQVATMERAYRPILEKAVAEAAAKKKDMSKK